MIMVEPPSFEEALVELEDIVTQLEAGDLSLEESLALFERGQRLAVLCNQVLDKAELRLEQIGSSESFPDSKEE
jgi:exodeoxyribonuclease VII small subunit